MKAKEYGFRHSGRRGSVAKKLFATAVLEDAPLFILVASFALIAIGFARLHGSPAAINLSIAWSWMVKQSITYAVPAFIAVAAHTVLTRRGSLRLPSTWRRIAKSMLSPAALLNYTAVLIALQILIQVFLAFKSALPAIQPFSWDVRFMQLDRCLHFGRDPYSLLQPFLGRPVITKIIDSVYLLWLPAMWFTVIWQAWHGSRETPVRSQFLLSFALCWIVLGTILAILLSSAGPVYYLDATGEPSPYNGLFNYLHATNQEHALHALRLQEVLWNAYRSPDIANIGISAMPSLHVAIAMLMAILGFAISRWVGLGYAAFAFLIFLGSIHLGWHYAVDGYLSALVTLALWWLSGRIVRWWDAKTGQFYARGLDRG